MIEFSSKAGGSVSMLSADGARLLALLGKEAQAVRGVITPEQLPAAIAALESAGSAQAEEHRAALTALEQRSEPAERTGPEAQEAPISLAQRAFPLIALMRRAQAAGVPVLWGI